LEHRLTREAHEAGQVIIRGREETIEGPREGSSRGSSCGVEFVYAARRIRQRGLCERSIIENFGVRFRAPVADYFQKVLRFVEEDAVCMCAIRVSINFSSKKSKKKRRKKERKRKKRRREEEKKRKKEKKRRREEAKKTRRRRRSRGRRQKEEGEDRMKNGKKGSRQARKMTERTGRKTKNTERTCP